MFFRSRRVRRDPYRLSTFEAQQPIRLDEARLEAWALSIGQYRDSPGPRPHRGMLPDVDVSRAVGVERRPGLIVRLFRRILGRGEQAATSASGRTEDSHAALGEPERKPYVWLVDAESEPFEPDESEPVEAVIAYNGSRAA